MFSRLNGTRFARPWRVPSTRPALTLRQTGIEVALAALASYPLAIQTEALTTSGETVVQKVRPAAEKPSSRGTDTSDPSANQQNFASTFASRAGPLRSASAIEIDARRTITLSAPARAPQPAAEPLFALPAFEQSAAKQPAFDEDAGAPQPAASKPPEPAEASEATEKRSSSAKAPTACLPASLKDVLSDVEALFGKVTIVSTTRLHTDNHWRSSVREKLHADCKAVDFRTLSATKDVIAYLRTRRDVGGINSYRNNVIHIDHSGARADNSRKTAKKKAPRRKSRQA